MLFLLLHVQTKPVKSPMIVILFCSANKEKYFKFKPQDNLGVESGQPNSTV
jgi:hypothetical protein